MKENLRQESIILNILRIIYYLKLTDTGSIQGSADIFIFLKKKKNSPESGSLVQFWVLYRSTLDAGLMML